MTNGKPQLQNIDVQTKYNMFEWISNGFGDRNIPLQYDIQYKNQTYTFMPGQQIAPYYSLEVMKEFVKSPDKVHLLSQEQAMAQLHRMIELNMAIYDASGLIQGTHFYFNNSTVENTGQTASQAHNGNKGAEDANAEAQKKLQVGPFEDLKQASPGSGLIRDHIPSFAAIVRDVQTREGRTLSPGELSQLRNQSLSLLYENVIHEESSRSFGARNRPIYRQDAKNLLNAVNKDIDALKPSLLKAGYSESDIENARKQLSEKYKTSE